MAQGDRQADDVRTVDGLRIESDDLRASASDSPWPPTPSAAASSARARRRAAAPGGFRRQPRTRGASMDADPAAAKDLLAEMARDIRDAIDQARELADRIYPPQLEVGGLVAALRSAAAEAEVPARTRSPVTRTNPPEVAGAVFFCFRRRTRARLSRRDPGDHDTEPRGRGGVRDRRRRRPGRGRSLLGDRIEALGRPAHDRVGVRPPDAGVGSLPLSG